MDPELSAFLTTFAKLGTLAAEHETAPGAPLLVAALAEHLGGPPAAMTAVTKELPAHRFADYDAALGLIAGPDAPLMGIGGGDLRHHNSLADLISGPWQHATVGSVDWAEVPVDSSRTRRMMSLGIRLFSYAGNPVAVLQRRMSRMHSEGQGVLEVIAPNADTAGSLLSELARLSTEHSVLRGQVISLEMVGFEGEGDGYRFLPRPEVPAEGIVLAAGVLERVTGHVLGIARHAEALRAHGQHLKRGVLLYGPPGTGKTLTVRHLIGAARGHTVVVLSGATLGLIGKATAIARHLQPAIVVLEDCDLVAMDRGFGEGVQPLLFEVLDALDGLASDADVAFVLTTNRVEVLEEALAQRPGRVDLAVEIPRPDQAERRLLLELYRGDVGYSPAMLDEVARRSEAHTASFFKELMRRAVLFAAQQGTEPDDEFLARAFEGLLSDEEALSRSLVGGYTADQDDDPEVLAP